MTNLPYLTQFNEFLGKNLKIFQSKTPKILFNAMEYSLNGGGKRIRPILFLNTYALFNDVDEIALNFAAGIEAFHTFTLIHDDLPCMDDDDFRRGKPTNHKVFGEGQAVLAGDALQNLCYYFMLESVRISGYNPNAVRAMQVFTNYVGLNGLIGGQSVDIDKNVPNDKQTIDYIYTHKTCDLICASQVCAAIISGASEENIKKIEKYAYNFGYIFQLVDDLLDDNGTNDDKSLVDILSKNEIKSLIENFCKDAINAINAVKTNKNVDFFKDLIVKSVERSY